MHAYCGQLGHHKQSSSQHSPKSPSLEAIFLAPLSLPYLYIYIYFFFFYSGGYIGKPWSCCLPFLPYHRRLPHINPKLCKYKGQWLPTNSTVYQLCNSRNHTPTAVVRVPQSYGCAVEEKNQSCIQFSLGFSYSSLVNSTQQVVPEHLGPF